MLWQKNYLALGLLGSVLLLSATTADNSVHILSKYTHQPLTSTTLKWLPMTHYDESKEIVIGGFENVTDGEGAKTPLNCHTMCARCILSRVPHHQLRNVLDNVCSIKLI
jgi:hypothetical protein